MTRPGLAEANAIVALLPEERRPKAIVHEGILQERVFGDRSFGQACVRARLPLPCALSPGTLSRVSATGEIFTREKKKRIYALRTTWRNSGPKDSRYSASR